MNTSICVNIRIVFVPILLCSTIFQICLSAKTAFAAAYESIGWKRTAIPLWNFSSDDGTGYGVRANLYEYDGTTVPYRRKFSAQLFFTTKGKWVHRLLMDTPQFRGSQDRLEIELLYEKEEFANYFGHLSKAETDQLKREQTTFSQSFPEIRIKWIRKLQLPWRLRLGGRLSHYEIDPNNRIGNILVSNNPLGAEGGTLAQGHIALRYDTRDDYNNSSSGLIEELLIEYSLGGGGDYNGLTTRFEHRHFAGLLYSAVFAQRLSLDWTFGDLPFYEELKMGGSSTVRGVSAARDRGEARFLINSELRWQGISLTAGKSTYLGGLIFVDTGQIFDRNKLPTSNDWRVGYGTGLRFHWHSTIVRADYGWSDSNTGIYITFSQVF